MTGKNQVMLLTGGNSGIGYYMVMQWLEDGGSAAVLDLSTDRLAELAARYPGRLLSVCGDVSNPSAAQEAVEGAMRSFGRLDVAVHNACLCPFLRFEEMSDEGYRKTLEVNLLGGIHLTRAVLPAMIEQKSGRICLTSSGVGVTGFPGISAYAASKGALESFAKCMRLECRGSGVSFHILHPPLTDTPSSSPLPVPREFKASAEKVGRGLARRLGSRRFIIAPSFTDALSVKASYLFSLSMGSLLARMTDRAAAPRLANDK